ALLDNFGAALGAAFSAAIVHALSTPSRKSLAVHIGLQGQKIRSWSSWEELGCLPVDCVLLSVCRIKILPTCGLHALRHLAACALGV
ncbi:MAG: hypothetical protein ACI9QQ_001474, partial [Myxococcota bacterium]